MWLLISRRPLGEVSVPIRRHPICPAAVENLPARSKHRFLLRSDVNLASHKWYQSSELAPCIGQFQNEAFYRTSADYTISSFQSRRLPVS